MSLDKLASEIESMAKAEAKEITDDAKAEAKRISGEAKESVKEYREAAIAQAERMSEQVAVESIAAARQGNQKRLLVARRAALAATWSTVKSECHPSMENRAGVLALLLEKATAESGEDMILRPVYTDRISLTESIKHTRGADYGDYHEFEIGEDIDGLGGFVLESPDGSVLMDYRFEGRLRDAWEASLEEVNKILFEE